MRSDDGPLDGVSKYLTESEQVAPPGTPLASTGVTVTHVSQPSSKSPFLALGGMTSADVPVTVTSAGPLGSMTLTTYLEASLDAGHDALILVLC